MRSGLLVEIVAAEIQQIAIQECQPSFVKFNPHFSRVYYGFHLFSPASDAGATLF